MPVSRGKPEHVRSTRQPADALEVVLRSGRQRVGRNSLVHSSRNKSDAKSDPCEIDQKIVAAQLDFRNQIQLMLLEERMQKFTGCTFSVQHDDRITLQFFEESFFPCSSAKDWFAIKTS